MPTFSRNLLLGGILTVLTGFAHAAKPEARALMSCTSAHGLQVDTRLVGIDHRVQDGKLYGVGDAGGVHAIDADTAAATLVNRLSLALDGTGNCTATATPATTGTTLFVLDATLDQIARPAARWYSGH